MYFTLDTYYEGIIPNECQTGSFMNNDVEYNSNVNVVYFDFKFNGDMSAVSYAFYFDQFAKPILVKTYETGDVVVIGVQMIWFSEVADYTLNVYSKMDLEITDADGNTSILNYDGQEPTGFTESTYRGMDWEAPAPVEDDDDEEGGDEVVDLTGLARIFAAESIGELIVAILALFFPFF